MNSARFSDYKSRIKNNSIFRGEDLTDDYFFFKLLWIIFLWPRKLAIWEFNLFIHFMIKLLFSVLSRVSSSEMKWPRLGWLKLW